MYLDSNKEGSQNYTTKKVNSLTLAMIFILFSNHKWLSVSLLVTIILLAMILKVIVKKLLGEKKQQ